MGGGGVMRRLWGRAAGALGDEMGGRESMNGATSETEEK